MECEEERERERECGGGSCWCCSGGGRVTGDGGFVVHMCMMNVQLLVFLIVYSH